MNIIKYIFVLLTFLSIAFISCGGEPTIIYTAPTIQIAEDLLKLQSRENEELYSYKLLDTATHIYQIPIDSAMVIFSNSRKNQ